MMTMIIDDGIDDDRDDDKDDDNGDNDDDQQKIAGDRNVSFT